MDARRQLQLALAVTGVAVLFAYPLMHLWPSGWMWAPHQYEYEQMIGGIYATVGVFPVVL